MLLFPIYWMVNVSLQPAARAVGTPWLPLDFSLDGYSKALSDQGRNLVTSLVVALGTRRVQPGDRGAGGVRAGPLQGPLARACCCSCILISQMIPGIVVANALYSAYTTSDCSTRSRA